MTVFHWCAVLPTSQSLIRYLHKGCAKPNVLCVFFGRVFPKVSLKLETLFSASKGVCQPGAFLSDTAREEGTGYFSSRRERKISNASPLGLIPKRVAWSSAESQE